MNDSDVKRLFQLKLEHTKDDLLRDLEAMSEEELGISPRAGARCGFDLAYEVIQVNRRIAARLRGEPLDAPRQDGWIKAPQDFKNKERAVEEGRAVMDEVLTAWEGLPDEDVTRSIPLPRGETSAVDLAFNVCYHTGYHDAQLNYIQTLHGDFDMHWA